MRRHVVTVFGGSGFIGRHLVRRLVAGGSTVRVAVRDVEAANFLKPMANAGEVVVMAADVTDAAMVEAAVAGAEAVVNLVGILYERGRRTFQRLHVDAAGTIARAAAEAGAGRLVQVSALGADAASPAAYGRTKAAGEAAAGEAFAGATIVRPSVVFGPEDGFFNMFAGLARLTPVLPLLGCPTLPRVEVFKDGGFVDVDLYGDGGTRFQPVYVGDVADAIVRILGDASTAGRAFELGGPRVYSFKEIMELLLAHIGRRRLLVPVPFAIAAIDAWFLEWLPVPPLTRDQVNLLRRDNVVSEGAATLADLGLEATPAEAVLPTYLHRFRPPKRQSPQPA
jgi:NADH dehydrogenase